MGARKGWFVARAVDRRSTYFLRRATLLTLCLLYATLSQLAAVAGASQGAGGTSAPAGGGTPANDGASSKATAPATKATGGSAPKQTAKKKAITKHVNPFTLSSAVCVPAIHCSTNRRQVSVGGELLIKGKGLRTGMVVAFPHSWNARIASNSPTAHLGNSSLGMVVHVPSSAHSGRIMVLISHGRHTNSFGPMQVVSYALHPPTPPKPPTAPPAPAPSGTAFNGQGMWIWYVSQSDGGNLASIIAQAQAADVTTLYVKSSRRILQLLEPVQP